MPDKKPNIGVPPTSPGAERALLLRDAVEHSVRVEQEAARPQRVQRSLAGRMAVVTLCVAVLAFSAYSWIARPEFIWGARPAPMRPQRVEANMRVAMFLISQRLEAYREREGEYPESLRDVDADTSFAYVLLDDSNYQLTGRAGSRQITLTANDDLRDFLGNSRDVIHGVPK